MKSQENKPPPFEPEGPETEWKERLPRPFAVARTLAAFANGVGGALWVGVRDDGRPVGVAPPPSATVDELRRIAQEHVVPPQELEVKEHRMGSITLLEARVPSSDDRPVMAPGRDGALTAFVRDGASTRRASRLVLKAWKRDAPKVTLDSRAKRVLKELKLRARFDAAGPTVGELARAASLGTRAAKRTLVILERAGLLTDRGGGRYGLTPEGHRRSK